MDSECDRDPLQVATSSCRVSPTNPDSDDQNVFSTFPQILERCRGKNNVLVCGRLDYESGSKINSGTTTSQLSHSKSPWY